MKYNFMFVCERAMLRRAVKALEDDNEVRMLINSPLRCEGKNVKIRELGQTLRAINLVFVRRYREANPPGTPADQHHASDFDILSIRTAPT